MSIPEVEPHTGHLEPGSPPPMPTWSMIVYVEVLPRHNARKSSPLNETTVELMTTSHAIVLPVSPLLQTVYVPIGAMDAPDGKAYVVSKAALVEVEAIWLEHPFEHPPTK